MIQHNLSRRQFTKLTSAAALSSLVPRGLRSTPSVSPRWPGYENAMVIDCLASPGPFNVPNRTGQPVSDAMLDNVARSGITAVNLTVNDSGPGHAAFDVTVRSLAYWERELTVHPDRLVKVQTVAALSRAKESGRLGLIYGFQDAQLLESQIDRVELFYDFGLRIIQLTYNARNDLGDGCLEPGNAGLSRFGRDVVDAMNEMGILVDLSHCGQRTTAEGIAHSAKPVAVTHSGCSAVFEHPRNKRDAELRALADKGGVVGIYMMPFLNPEGPARLEHFMQHVEHAINVCGEDHVGVGSDNSITPTVADERYLTALYAFADERARLGIGAPREHEVLFVEELNTPRRMETIADELLRRGHSEARVEKVIGDNWVRLFADVWQG